MEQPNNQPVNAFSDTPPVEDKDLLVWPPKPTESGLRLWQERVFQDPTRFRVACCGRRAGKTVLALNELIRAAQAGMNQTVWYVAPTYKMAKRIMWRMLKEAIPEKNILKKDETNLEITLKGTNSLIALKGCEDPDTLLGDSLSFLVVDEAQSIKMDVVDTVLRPAMDDQNADGLYIGTPRGMGDNAMYQLYLRGKMLPDWSSYTITTAEAGNVSPENIAAAKNTIPLTKFRQEYEASFESVQGRVFYNFCPVKSIREDIVDIGGELFVGMDFNVSKMTACVGQKIGDEFQVIDEFVIENANTRLMCQEIQKRFPNRQITTFPDPSGRARKTSAEVGQTDFAIIKSFGFGLIAPKKHPLVVDSINDVNALMMNAAGVRKLFIHPRCKEVIKCLDGLLYKEGTSQPDKTTGLDHMVDALRYIISSQFSIIKREVQVLTLDWTY